MDDSESHWVRLPQICCTGCHMVEEHNRQRYRNLPPQAAPMLLRVSGHDGGQI